MKKFWIAFAIVCLVLIAVAAFILVFMDERYASEIMLEEKWLSPWYLLLVPAGAGAGILTKIWQDEHGGDDDYDL